MPQINNGPIPAGTKIYRARANVEQERQFEFPECFQTRAAQGEIFSFFLFSPHCYSMVETMNGDYHWKIRANSIILVNYKYENVEPHEVTP